MIRDHNRLLLPVGSGLGIRSPNPGRGRGWLPSTAHADQPKSCTRRAWNGVTVTSETGGEWPCRDSNVCEHRGLDWSKVVIARD